MDYLTLIYDETNQQYYTTPDGSIATHKMIHDYYESKNNNKITKKTRYYADGEIIFETEEED